MRAGPTSVPREPREESVSLIYSNLVWRQGHGPAGGNKPRSGNDGRRQHKTHDTRQTGRDRGGPRKPAGSRGDSIASLPHLGSMEMASASDDCALSKSLLK